MTTTLNTTRARGLLAKGELEMEYRIVRPDGEVRWLHDRARVIRDADGPLDQQLERWRQAGPAR